MKQNLKADLYVFDIHYHDEPVEHFQNVKNYRHLDVIVDKDYFGNPVEVLDTKEQVLEKMLTYLNCCDEFTNEEDDHGTQSAWRDDQEKLMDFLNSCQSETGKFLFYTLDGTDLEVLYVHDFQTVYNDHMLYIKIWNRELYNKVK